MTEEQKLRNAEHKRKWAENNREKVKEARKKWKDNNKERNVELQKQYRERNADKIKERRKVYNDKNKEKHKEYYKENREKIITYQREYKKKKKETDPLFKLKNNFSKLLFMSFKRKGYTKKSRTHVILGCDFDTFKKHLESQFEPWMTWDNKGLYNGQSNFGWDIDHIIPQSNAKTEEEFLKINHYTNLQPLCSHINRDIKKNKGDF